MTEHPYWSYGPDHGASPVDALAEGRRLAALEKAFMATAFDNPGADRTDAVLASAAKIEAYLEEGGSPKGVIVVSQAKYRALMVDSDKLARLEAAGVDNWEGYGDALRDDDGE